MELQARIQMGLRQLKMQAVNSMLATVKTVDATMQTCDCMTADGVEVFDVRLKAAVDETTQGMYAIPKIGSHVLISRIGTGDLFFVSCCTDVTKLIIEVDEVVFNTGKNGGLVLITELTTMLNKLVSELTGELAKVATGVSVGGGAYTPGLLSSFVLGDYENKKIMQ